MIIKENQHTIECAIEGCDESVSVPPEENSVRREHKLLGKADRLGWEAIVHRTFYCPEHNAIMNPNYERTKKGIEYEAIKHQQKN